MTKSSPWPKMLPALGILLAIALLAAAGSVWWSGSGTTTVSDGGLGELIAVTQATRAQANAALLGDAASFDALVESRTAVTSLRSVVGSNEAATADARRLGTDPALWQRIERNLDTILESRERLANLEKARADVFDLGPQLLTAAATLASTLPPADLTANQPYLQRFELTIESLQQQALALGPVAPVADTVRRLEDAEQYLGQFVRGLRGDDATLGIVAVRDDGAAVLRSITDLEERAREAVATIRSGAETLTAASTASDDLDSAAAELLKRYRATDVSIAAAASGGVTARLPLLLVFAALALAALMMFVYYRGRDFRYSSEDRP